MEGKKEIKKKLLTISC